MVILKDMVYLFMDPAFVFSVARVAELRAPGVYWMEFVTKNVFAGVPPEVTRMNYPDDLTESTFLIGPSVTCRLITNGNALDRVKVTEVSAALYKQVGVKLSYPDNENARIEQVAKFAPDVA